MSTGQRAASEPTANPAVRATVADVARLAEVSLKTASRALTGAESVKDSTREKVLDAAKALRFRPNAIARELRTGGVASTMGFVIGDITNPFYAQVAAGVSEAMAERGLTLVVAASDDRPEREQPTVTQMLERRVLALLLVPIAADHSYLEGERQFGTPVIAVDRPLSGTASDSVVFDNRAGACSGVLALMDAGHRRIGFVGSSERLYTHGERAAGYRDAHALRGYPVQAGLLRDDAAEVESARSATLELLELAEPPTAIFAANNRATMGAYQAIRSRGTGTGLLGFDDLEFADALGISVVGHSPREMGATAARLAISRLEDLSAPLEQAVLPTTLLLRGSHRAVVE